MKYSYVFTNTFTKSYKKLLKQDKNLEKDFDDVLSLLIRGLHLPVKYKDHKLKGNMEGYYDFHLRYDLVVIRYYKTKEDVIIFSDIGSHKEVFGD